MTDQPIHLDALIDQYRRRRVIVVVATTILWFVVSAAAFDLIHKAWLGDPTDVKILLAVVAVSAAWGQFLNARDIVRLARS